MPPPIRRKYLRSEEAHRQIIEAADAIFRRDGYARTTVGEMARALGMTPANIYKHFSSKREIAEHVCAHYLGEVCALMLSIAASDQSRAARLEHMLVAHYRYHREHGLQDPNMLELVLLSLDGEWEPAQAFRRELLNALQGMVKGANPLKYTWRSAADFALAILDCMQAVMHPKILIEIPAAEVEQRIKCVAKLLSPSFADE